VEGESHQGGHPAGTPRPRIEELIAAGLVEEYDLVGIGVRWHVYRCRVCGCGPWIDQAHVIEHFQILGTDRAEHLRLYREFLRLYQG
jgi:NMD protein affecting ribosome stability and mRNA decay